MLRGVPNGKPRDHPVTDIAVHRLPTYSLEVDSLVAEIYSLSGVARLYAEVPELYELWQPLGTRQDELPSRVVEKLRTIRDEELDRARSTGWDPDPGLEAIRDEFRARWMHWEHEH